MTNRYFNPFVFYNDDDGRVLANAQLFFRNATITTLLKNVYQDPELTLPWNQPVVADAAGRFPPIWMEDDQYFIELRDGDGVQLRTVGNYNFDLVSTVDNTALICRTVDDMKAGILIDGTNINFKVNDIVDTIGYSSEADGQAGRYRIITFTVPIDDGTLIDVGNSLAAELISLQHDKTIVDPVSSGQLILTYGKDPYLNYFSSTISGNINVIFTTPATSFGEFSIKADAVSGGSTITINATSASGAPLYTLADDEYTIVRYVNGGWIQEFKQANLP